MDKDEQIKALQAEVERLERQKLTLMGMHDGYRSLIEAAEAKAEALRQGLRGDPVRRLIKDALTQYHHDCTDFIKHPGPAADALIEAISQALAAVEAQHG